MHLTPSPHLSTTPMAHPVEAQLVVNCAHCDELYPRESDENFNRQICRNLLLVDACVIV